MPLQRHLLLLPLSLLLLTTLTLLLLLMPFVFLLLGWLRSPRSCQSPIRQVLGLQVVIAAELLLELRRRLRQ